MRSEAALGGSCDKAVRGNGTAFAPTSRVTCRTVFVVEDDPALCDVLREELQEAGWAAIGFTTPSAALAEIEMHPPDVVLVDYGLPEMMGDAFLRAVHERVPEVSLVLMSGDPRAVRLDSGTAWHMLTKPFPIERVLSALDSALPATSDLPAATRSVKSPCR